MVRPSLIATSSDDPTRIVTTRQLALSPLTLNLKRYLYAIDDADGSVMVFDVSDDSDTLSFEARLTTTWRSRPHPFPGAHSTRGHRSTPKRRDRQHHGATTPVLCDADPDSTGPGTAYQTSDNYGEGAGPQRLRGVLAFAVLTSGDVVVIDVEDYDAPCRGPAHPSAARGCANEGEALRPAMSTAAMSSSPTGHGRYAYLAYVEDIVENMPGLTPLPLLFDNGSLLQRDADDPFALPSMRAVIQGDGGDDPRWWWARSRDPRPEYRFVAFDHKQHPGTTENSLSVNLVEPRAHLLDQSWTVTYEEHFRATNRFAQSAQPRPASNSEIPLPTSARVAS